MLKPSIEYLLQGRRFVEVLYFGTLEIAFNPSARTHLYLGLSCCATVKPIAKIERDMLQEQTDQNLFVCEQHESLVVGRDTSLVNEGLHHLNRAISLDPEIQFPLSCQVVVIEVMRDLRDYSRQEFRGFRSNLGYSLRTAAVAALVLLSRLQMGSMEGIDSLIESELEAANELLEKLFNSQSDQASFYTLISD